MNNTNGGNPATTALVRTHGGNPHANLPTVAPKTMMLLDGMTIHDIAESCANSGMFKDLKSAWQAIVKIKAGLELGIPPIQAINGLYIIEGKISMAAPLMAGLIKASGRYTYRIQQHDENACVIQFFERNDDNAWTPCGPVSSFSMADAHKAGLTGKSVWKSWPRNMLFARAMSNGARWYCGDVFLGPVYVPEELDADVDENGDVVYDAQPQNVVQQQTVIAPIPKAVTQAVETALKELKPEPSAPVADSPVAPAPTPPATPPDWPKGPPPNTQPPIRNSWQREAALTIYPKVAPEVAIEIRQTGANPLFDEIEFTRYLITLAKDHVIALPDGVRPVEALLPDPDMPDPNQEALFDEDGGLINGTPTGGDPLPMDEATPAPQPGPTTKPNLTRAAEAAKRFADANRPKKQGSEGINAAA